MDLPREERGYGWLERHFSASWVPGAGTRGLDFGEQAVARVIGLAERVLEPDPAGAGSFRLEGRHRSYAKWHAAANS